MPWVSKEAQKIALFKGDYIPHFFITELAQKRCAKYSYIFFCYRKTFFALKYREIQKRFKKNLVIEKAHEITF